MSGVAHDRLDFARSSCWNISISGASRIWPGSIAAWAFRKREALPGLIPFRTADLHQRLDVLVPVSGGILCRPVPPGKATYAKSGILRWEKQASARKELDPEHYVLDSSIGRTTGSQMRCSARCRLMVRLILGRILVWLSGGARGP